MANDIYLTDREADVMRVLWEHGASVVTEVKDKLADELAYTTVLTILRTLEQKGYVRSWFGGATEERGGRSKRFFEITGAGELAVKNALRVADNMVTGLREIGGMA